MYKSPSRLSLTLMNHLLCHAPFRENETTATMLKSKSKRWKDRFSDIQSAKLKSCGHLRSEHSSGTTWGGDAPAGCTHFIIADTVTKGRLDVSALKAFKNAFAQRLSEELPSIAIATLNPNNDGPVNSNMGVLAGRFSVSAFDFFITPNYYSPSRTNELTRINIFEIWLFISLRRLCKVIR